MEGVFTPSEEAKELSIARHFNNTSTPVIARFSVGGGSPKVPDYHDTATPKGIAIRFQIDDGTHTDMICHSFKGFATRTGEEFLTFLQLTIGVKKAKGRLESAKSQGGDHSKEQESLNHAEAAFKNFLAGHPSAATFALAPKPNPFNYGTITYYQVNTHILTNADGRITYVRYRLDPEDGHHLYNNDSEEFKKLGSNYLEDDLKERFPAKPIRFTVVAHVANFDDVLDDATVPYKSSTFVPIGKLEINKISDNNAAKQKELAFSPVPESGGINGIKSSADPLIQVRKDVYWISADQRRKEKQVE